MALDHTRANAVQILNEAKLCQEGNQKVTLLSQLSELVVRKEPGLSPEFIPDLVVLQLDSFLGVRKWLSTFLGEACSQCPSPTVLELTTGGLAGLLQDSAPGVVKQALFSCIHLIRGALGQLALNPMNEELISLMENVQKIASSAVSISVTHKNDSVKVAGVKLRENMVLLFTAEHAPRLPGNVLRSSISSCSDVPLKLPSAAALAQEADAQLRGLLDMFRQQQQAGQGVSSGTLLIVLIKALSGIGVQRPGLLGRLLPSLMLLAKEGGYRASGSEEAVPLRGGEVSVGNALRLALSSIIRSRIDTSVPWRDRIVEALGHIGAEDAADSSLKYIQRQEYKEQKASKSRNRQESAEAEDQPNKRPKVGGSLTNGIAAPAEAVSMALGHATCAGGQLTGGSEVNTPPVTSASDLQQVMTLLGAILATGDRTMLAAFISNLPVSALADVVIHHMPNLPLGPPSSLSFMHVVGTSATSNISTATTSNTLPVPQHQRPPHAPPTQRPVSTPSPPPVTWQQTQHARLQGGYNISSTYPPYSSAYRQPPYGGPPPQAAYTQPPPPPGPPPNLILPPQSVLPSQQHPVPPVLLAVPPASAPDMTAQQHAPPAYLPSAAGLVGTAFVTKPGMDPGMERVGGPNTQVTGAGSRSQPQGHQKVGTSVAPPPPAPPAAPHVPSLGLPVPQLGWLSGSAPRHLPLGQPALPKDIRPTAPTALPLSATAGSALVGSGPEPLLLASEQLAELRRRAEFGELLLARMAASDPKDVGQLMLDHVVKEWKDDTGGEGLQVAERWLNALFVEYITEHGQQKTTSELPSTSGERGLGHDDKADKKGKESGIKEDALKKEVDALNLVTNDERHSLSTMLAPVASTLSSTALSETPYEEALLLLLNELWRLERQEAVKLLLLQAPCLTLPGTVNFLQSLIDHGGDWASVALSAARSLIQERPPFRSAALDLVLQAAAGLVPETRSKAVRLVCNQLIREPQLEAAIVQFASAALSRLVPKSIGVSSNIIPSEVPPSDSTFSSQEEATRFCELYSALCVVRPALLEGLAEAAAHSGVMDPAATSALQTAAVTIARALGVKSRELLSLVKQHPAGSEHVVRTMVDAAVNGEVPTVELVEACRCWYLQSQDVKIMAPLVVALPRAEVLSLMPHLLQLQGANIRSLFKKLATPQILSGSTIEPMFSPSELLVALHCPEEWGGLADVSPIVLRNAISEALHAPETFPQQALAAAISKMEGRSPLPQLFMRTVILAVKSAPTLRGFVSELLSRLVSKQIWLDKAQWRGFLMLVENSDRTFFSVLLQLPKPVLEACILPSPTTTEPYLQEHTAIKLALFASSAENPVQVLSPIQQLLDMVLARYREATAAASAAVDQAVAAVAEEAKHDKNGSSCSLLESSALEVAENLDSNLGIGRRDSPDETDIVDDDLKEDFEVEFNDD
ncbi:hypothetical protein CEUSTIGMA_g12076.t1 [Chlamydomonas eustigma]|uniref:Symplekin C-terminal domain-containing protein n=1 Tax=Chlamydomonas eustigma TaxID=1157962 RepID=A0A250XNI7_9CHLO|nr:hypothetical protein CEUSTIGMA_g12076.t1 [Chlamydomonas eustigma]|eukprot:GAX84655.1 hypothetical protein CEUSTIGMA_g12076.t1 [Chlamydomonas eustigma]